MNYSEKLNFYVKRLMFQIATRWSPYTRCTGRTFYCLGTACGTMSSGLTRGVATQAGWSTDTHTHTPSATLCLVAILDLQLISLAAILNKQLVRHNGRHLWDTADETLWYLKICNSVIRALSWTCSADESWWAPSLTFSWWNVVILLYPQTKGVKRKYPKFISH